jgi:hypothetical protein
MNRVFPFSDYDFFGYLASGAMFLCVYDYVYNGGTQIILHKDWLPAQVFMIFLAAYVAGHIIASISSLLVEKLLIQKVIGCPEILFFASSPPKGWKGILSMFWIDYCLPADKELQKKVLDIASKSQITSPGRALFHAAHNFAKTISVVKVRMDSFLNIYGFCRNISMMAFISLLMLLVKATNTDSVTDWQYCFWALVTCMGMFYRYLKFYKHYTWEVLTTFAFQ